MRLVWNEMGDFALGQHAFGGLARILWWSAYIVVLVRVETSGFPSVFVLPESLGSYT